MLNTTFRGVVIAEHQCGPRCSAIPEPAGLETVRNGLASCSLQRKGSCVGQESKVLTRVFLWAHTRSIYSTRDDVGDDGRERLPSNSSRHRAHEGSRTPDKLGLWVFLIITVCLFAVGAPADFPSLTFSQCGRRTLYIPKKRA